MFVPFVSQRLSNGPALRCFRENTSLRCQLNVNGVQPAGVKEQLMESVVLFLPDLSFLVCERESGRPGVCQCG